MRMAMYVKHHTYDGAKCGSTVIAVTRDQAFVLKTVTRATYYSEFNMRARRTREDQYPESSKRDPVMAGLDPAISRGTCLYRLPVQARL